MKKTFFLILLIFSMGSTAVFAQNTIELKASFPAPIGIYDRLRLVPRAEIAPIGTSCEIGYMYINMDDSNELYYCKDVGGGSGQWDKYRVLVGDGIWTQASGQVWLTIPSDRVGIDTTTPQAQLHLAKDGVIALSGGGGLGGGGQIPPLLNHSGPLLIYDTKKGVFRAGYTTGSQWHNANNGIHTMALNQDTSAKTCGYTDGSGNLRFGCAALGKGTEASSADFPLYNQQIAMGLNTKATGQSSIAFGEGSQAIPGSGTTGYNMAIGKNTIAQGSYTLAMGEGSQAYQNNSIAGGLNSRTNASDPANDISSVALGNGANANGKYSVALGKDTVVDGDYSTAMGERDPGTCATCGTKSNYSMSMGHNTTAGVNKTTGTYATAMGDGTQALGNFSLAMGKDTKAIANYSVATGEASEAGTSATIGQYAVAMGYNTKATGNYSVAMGHGTTPGGTIASGSHSIAVGKDAKATGSNSFALGENIEVQGTDTIAVALNDQAGFAVTANNALVIRGGPARVGINKIDPQYELDVVGEIFASVAINCPSDRRLKEDIQPIEDALDKITEINGITYRWKDKNMGKEVQMGLIAQKVEKVFPEVIITDKDGIKAMDYGRLLGAATEAIKELNVQMNEMQERNDALKNRLDAVEKIYKSSF